MTINLENIMLKKNLNIPRPSLINFDAKTGDYFIADGAVWMVEDSYPNGVRAVTHQWFRVFKYDDLRDLQAFYIPEQAVEAWSKSIPGQAFPDKAAGRNNELS